MKRIFQRWGIVEEVFIARRVNRWGNRYGFIRLWDVTNPVRLERELDSIRIGMMKLTSIFPSMRKVEKGLRKKGTKRNI